MKFDETRGRVLRISASAEGSGDFRLNSYAIRAGELEDRSRQLEDEQVKKGDMYQILLCTKSIGLVDNGLLLLLLLLPL
jgi:hypothetical protein